jgi:hypothetical protein
MLLDILIPQDRQRHMLVALELAVQGVPIGFRAAPIAPLLAGIAVEPGFKVAVAEPFRQRPGQTGSAQPLDRRPHRRRRNAGSPGDLPNRYVACGHQSENLVHLAHGGPLCWHGSILWLSKRSEP